MESYYVRRRKSSSQRVQARGIDCRLSSARNIESISVSKIAVPSGIQGCVAPTWVRVADYVEQNGNGWISSPSKIKTLVNNWSS